VNRPLVPQDPSKLLDAALDVFVYAPIGFLFEARDVVPRLAERGRGQVALARLFGRYAWQRGQAEADRILRTNRVGEDADQATVATDASTEPRAQAPAPASASEIAAAVTDALRPQPKRTTRTSRATPEVSEELAIPGYDSLSASQVVPRLDALLPDELEAVRVYEVAHRGRRTILNRIAQLQA
jgi:hypothetical protein